MTVDVAILGGGISGLSFAYFLERKHPYLSTVLLEPQARVGGWVQTVELPSKQIYETGPRCFRLRGASAKATSELIFSLGLEKELIKASSLANARYVILDGVPQKLPMGLLDIFTTSIGRELAIKTLLEPFRKKGTSEDESVASFFARRAPSPLVQKLADALVSGIWGGDATKLSIQHAFPELKNFELQYSSCFLGGLCSLFRKKEKLSLSGMYSFKKGLSQFISSLVTSLKTPIFLSKKVTNISKTTSGYILETASGIIEAKKIVFALPEKELNTLFPQLLAEKGLCPHASFATVVMGWREDLLQNKGFGMLAPSSEDPNVLGIVFDSSVFPEQNTKMKTRFTVIMGGARAPLDVDKDDGTLFTTAFSRVRAWTKTTSFPEEWSIIRAKDAIAQPPVGAPLTKMYLASQDNTLFAIGPSIGGVSMNQCILSAQELVNRF